MARAKEGMRHFLLKLESYEGEDTFVRCGDERQDYLYAIVVIAEDNTAEIVDSSYRSAEEAIDAWPEVAPTTKG